MAHFLPFAPKCLVLVGHLPWTWRFGCSRSMLQALDNFARRTSMTRRQKDPLRALTQEERNLLVRISRSHAEPASHVARAKALLAVAEGKSYTEAAKTAGRRSGDAVSHLVSRFNREGLAALEPGHGGG